MVISGFLRGGAGFLEGVGGAGADERLGKVLGDGGGEMEMVFLVGLGWVRARVFGSGCYGYGYGYDTPGECLIAFPR